MQPDQAIQEMVKDFVEDTVLTALNQERNELLALEAMASIGEKYRYTFYQQRKPDLAMISTDIFELKSAMVKMFKLMNIPIPQEVEAIQTMPSIESRNEDELRSNSVV